MVPVLHESKRRPFISCSALVSVWTVIMIIFLFQKIKDRKPMHDFAIGLTDACWTERKEIKRRVRRITGWQGWKNVIVSMRSKIEEERHYRKSPGASNYLEELTSVVTQ